MARKPKKETAVINATLLAEIVSLTKADSFKYLTATEYQPLVEAGLVETNAAIQDGVGGIATRATVAGIEAIGGDEVSDRVTAEFQQPIIDKTKEIMSNVAITPVTGFIAPPRKRGRKASAYDFDGMAVGGMFFVPKPAKLMSSIVSAATARYAVEKTDGSTRKNKKGELVPAKEAVRKFELSAVEAGKVYGTWTAPADGSVVIRTK